MTRLRALVAIGLACTACSADRNEPGDQAAAANGTTGCIDGGGGYLHAQLRGAMVADLDWTNAEMQCDGGPRPDEKGIRLTFAGKLPDTDRQLRFIFGIDEHDIAAGAAQALPTNLTVILEGEQELYATRGSERCAVETLERTALEQRADKRYRVHARGYCLAPATNVAGDARLLVPTFEFTGIADAELAP
jgi:hypothetical protein